MGAVVAGGGAAIGTGAFSSVEATRSVDVNTAGDAGGLVGLEITNDALEGEDGDTIEFNLEDLNIDAVTRFEPAFEVTNNRDSGSIDLEIEDGDGNDITTEDADDEDAGMYFEIDDLDDLDGIGNGDTVTFDIVFNLEGATTTDDADDEIPEDIVITATGGS